MKKECIMEHRYFDNKNFHDDQYNNEDDWDADVNSNDTYDNAAARLTNDFSYTSSISHRVATSVRKMQAMEEQAKRTLTCGRDDRATSEQVLDPRTRMVLFKLLSAGLFESLQGCVSTGKEANVYFATAGNKIKSTKSTSTTDAREFAVKVYKTSILVFRDRDKYVAGEHRWRHSYCKSNPRKMVNLWAEKEMRNYKRIYHAGIPCPQPILLKSHILVMEFLGCNGWPSPRLKDAKLTENRLREAYIQCILILRHLFQRCKLVHGDFSEYNVLWHDNQIFVIDVSQSVESHHPSALDFLRSDIVNINTFFKSHKVSQLAVMTTRQLFDFVTTSDMDNEHDQLDNIMLHVETKALELASCGQDLRRRLEQQEAMDEAVFMSRFLPKSLHQVADYTLEKLQQHTQGAVEEGLAQDIAGLVADNHDVVDAVLFTKDCNGSSKNSISMRDTKRTVTFTSDVDDKTIMLPVLNPESLIEIDVCDKFAPDTIRDVVNPTPIDQSHNNIDNSLKYCSEDDSLSGGESSVDHDFDDDDDDDDSLDSEKKFLAQRKTPDELEAARIDKKAQRKVNKKAVKEAQSEKRRNKLKKKDKRMAVKKSKLGTRQPKQ